MVIGLSDYDYISVPCCSWTPEFRRSSHGETASVLRKREALKWSAKSQTIWKSATFSPSPTLPWMNYNHSLTSNHGMPYVQWIPPTETPMPRTPSSLAWPADLKDLFFPQHHLLNNHKPGLFSSVCVCVCVCVQISSILLNKTQEKNTLIFWFTRSHFQNEHLNVA